MGKKRFYDAVRDLIRDVQDPIEEPARSRPRLSIASLLAGPQTCAACWDPIPDVDHTVFACNNCPAAYCPSCLEQYARTALKDRQILPLRCADQKCRAPVPLSGLRGLLSKDEIARLSRFQCELLRSPDETADDASDITSSETSQPDDGGDAALESLMGTMGWRRCPDCGMGIERTQGCSHMVCVCGGEFCYACGGRWGVGGFGCPRRCGFPLGQAGMLGLLPARFEAMRDEVWARIAALLDNLGDAMEVCQAHRLNRDIEIGQGLPARPHMTRHEPRRCIGPELRPPPILRGLESPTIERETPPAKMRLRSLVHPSRENRL